MHLDQMLTELSRNNELPPESKLQETIQLRSQANEDLRQIDMEIQHLVAKREQVQRSLGIFNAILSPARRLLPDILREIFYHCVVQPYPILSATEAPMVLTRVCSLWRSVALSSPRIWTRLHIPIPGDPQFSSRVNNDRGPELRHQMFSKTMELRCQAVKEWLGRSGSLPLSLSISYPFGYEPSVGSNVVEDDEVADPLFRTIRPFASRWRDFNLSMPFHIYQKLETQIPLDNLSMLRHFTGIIHVHSSTQPTLIPLHIIELPSLETLSLNCLQLTIHLGHYQNSWNRLTDIRFMSPITDTDLLGMLRQCPNLITLDVNIQSPWFNSGDREPDLATVLLPHLESLKLHETGSPSQAIPAVNAPSLKLLQYRCPPRYSNFDANEPLAPTLVRPDSLFWLISNSAASLEILSIDPLTFEPEHLWECLRLALHVKELILGDKDLFPLAPLDFEEEILSETCGPSILEIFTVHTTGCESSTPGSNPLQNDILLPNLESLEANGGHTIADQNFRRILESRIDAAHRGFTSPLRRVAVQFSRTKKEDILPEIVARARGVGMEMKLDLVYRPSGRNYGPLSPSFLLPRSSGKTSFRYRA
ncbi:hypothetical protein M413DRAFT_445447 [Hebeloma cylindrosporum]|uniref:F-box domain-containing protein n=1 Tax=Hebeloma cylindrosporum TaxID=76867 RepID=A0A0C3CCW3_HEBCY|nr:hypothetical protein M413DRAFT_445447 [Hebeloma cylindrosporum h7]